MIRWKEIGVANLAGVISLAAGLLMWMTSLHPVRQRFFELFFYTHQLYVVFVVFLVLHVGDSVFSIAAGSIFLFMLDRFLRFWQSRAKVDIVSAACRPCGTMELVFSKPASKIRAPLITLCSKPASLLFSFLFPVFCISVQSISVKFVR
jgi:hypothetical protein